MHAIPRKMQAAILTELKKPLTVAEINLPEQLTIGQVLVKIHFSGICGSQLGEIDGIKGSDKYLPHLLGHEASGTVIAIGPGVRHVKSGNKVVLHWRKGNGIDAETPTYSWNGARVNAGWVTTLSEYSIVSENRLTVIPDDSDLEVASLLGCAVTTGFGIVENNAKLRIGESVVIFGAGGIGLNIIQAAALVSAYPIVAIDLYEDKLNLAKQMGATHVINSRNHVARTQVLNILGPRKLDVFIDNTGIPHIIELGYEITHSEGRVILVGVPRQGAHINIYSLPLHFGKKLIGSHGGEIDPSKDIARYHKLYQIGKIKLRELITDYFSLTAINHAISCMRNGDIQGRCLIQM